MLKCHITFESLYCVTFQRQRNLWQILTFGADIPSPLYWRAKFAVLQKTHDLRLCAKFSLDQFILLPSGGEKPQILSFFGLWHFVVSPVGSNLRNLNTRAQLQTFPYPRYQNRFCIPTPSWQNWAHNPWRSKAWRTNRWTQKKLYGFWPPRRRVKSSPTKHGMVIEDLKHVLGPRKLLGSGAVLPLGELKVWGNPSPST